MELIFNRPKREIDRVFLHCSASSLPAHDDVSVIRSWHLKNGWSDIGYHYFIKFDGMIQVGRNLEQTPAAQKGHNVEFIAGPDGWEAPKKSKLGKEYAYTFDTPGVYLYQCTPHKSMGMIAVVVVGDGDNDISGAKVKGKSKKKLKEILEQL